MHRHRGHIMHLISTNDDATFQPLSQPLAGVLRKIAAKAVANGSMTAEQVAKILPVTPSATTGKRETRHVGADSERVGAALVCKP